MSFYRVIDFESAPKPIKKEEQKKIKPKDIAHPDKKTSLKEPIEKKALDLQEILIILSLLFVLLALQLSAL